LSAIAAEPAVRPTPPRDASLWRFVRRNPTIVAGGSILGVIALLAVLAPLFAGDAITMHPALRLRPPSEAYWLGADHLGRDVFARTVYGAQVSLFVGVSVATMSIACGLFIGLMAGYFRKVDAVVMRLMDVMLALPSLLLAVAVVAVLGPGLANAMFAIAIVMLPHFVRLTRGAVLGELAKDYVQASRLAGAGTARLMFDTVLPNCAAPLIVQATLGFSSAILDAAALGFLGLGAQPPTPEWGSMLASALEFIQSAWWVVTLPGLAILITVLAFNLTGDGLRDALDPKLKT